MNGDAQRALAAGIGLAVVVVTYGPSFLGDGGRWWAATVAIGLAVAAVDVLPLVRRLLPVPGLAPSTIVAALVAVFLCVPETDQIPIAAFLPVVVVALEVVGRRQVGLEWYAVAAASVLWAGMFGASGRQSALVGALFAWWAVALLPLVHTVRPIRSTRAAIAVATIGAVAALVLARSGGIATEGSTAWAATAVVALVSFVVAIAVARVLDGRAGDDNRAGAGVSATP